MLKVRILIASIFLLLAKLVQADEVFSEDIQKILNLREDQIDAGAAALFFAKDVYPNIVVSKYSEMLDMHVNNVHRLTLMQPKQDPATQIRVLNAYLYQMLGIHYDPSPKAHDNQENYFLPRILDTREGICVNMPMLYMAIAHRLGYPIYMVAAPEHFFLKYVGDGLAYKNIEATKGGEYASDSHYIYNLNISKKGIESGAYLHPLNNKEFVAMLLMQNSLVLAKRMETDKSIFYLKKAIELNPKEPLFYRNLAFRYTVKGKHAETIAETKEYAKIIRYNIAKSEELGFVSDPDENTRKKL